MHAGKSLCQGVIGLHPGLGLDFGLGLAILGGGVGLMLLSRRASLQGGTEGRLIAFLQLLRGNLVFRHHLFVGAVEE